MEVPEGSALVSVGDAADEGTEGAQGIAGGRLDLDHVCAQIAQQATGVGSRDCVAAFEHSHSRQRQRCWWVSLTWLVHPCAPRDSANTVAVASESTECLAHCQTIVWYKPNVWLTIVKLATTVV